MPPLGLLLLVWGQEQRCGTKTASALERQVQALTLSGARLNGDGWPMDASVLEIPIVYHVLHDGADGLVSAERLMQQTSVLNSALQAAQLRFTVADVNVVASRDW